MMNILFTLFELSILMNMVRYDTQTLKILIQGMGHSLYLRSMANVNEACPPQNEKYYDYAYIAYIEYSR